MTEKEKQFYTVYKGFIKDSSQAVKIYKKQFPIEKKQAI